MGRTRSWLLGALGSTAVLCCSLVNAPDEPGEAAAGGSGLTVSGGGGAGGGTGGGTAGSTAGGGTGGTGGEDCGPLNTLENCGACGVPCEPANANSPTCATGTCSYASCVQPYLDCDDDGANGCEIDPTSDPAHCGGCDQACADAGLANVADYVCDGGTCDYTTCAALFGDCDNDRSNGCETPTNTLSDCGGCGVACSPEHALGPTCASGTCGYASCEGAWDDCDNDTANGCEADLMTDQDHCGGCGQPCTGAETCVNGGCTLGVPITNGDGYGHHGACSGWNGCGDAATCALWACNYRGYASLVSYGVTAACNSGQFTTCHLFYDQFTLQENWGTSCAVMGVGDILCGN